MFQGGSPLTSRLQTPKLGASILVKPSRWPHTTSQCSTKHPKTDGQGVLVPVPGIIPVPENTLRRTSVANSRGTSRNGSTSDVSDWTVFREQECRLAEGDCIHHE